MLNQILVFLIDAGAVPGNKNPAEFSDEKGSYLLNHVWHQRSTWKLQRCLDQGDQNCDWSGNWFRDIGKGLSVFNLEIS